MKKIFILAFGLVSLVSTAQKTIIDEKIDKTISFNSKVFPNANTLNVLSTRNKISELSSYSSEGNKAIILKDSPELSYLFLSNTENNILTYDISKGPFKSFPKYIIAGKEIDVKDKKSLINFTTIFLNQGFFNTENEYKLASNKKDLLANTKDYDLLKGDVFLNIRNIKSGILQSNSIKFVDLKKLTGENFIKSEEKLGCKIVSNFDDSIDFITKSISKDYKKVVLYKTRISNKAEKINEVAFNIELPGNSVFIYSNNKAGDYTYGGYQNKFLHFGDDLFINNYIEDTTNGDVFIYGLFSDKIEKLNERNNILGYYVFKFDKNGNKIWESINSINDPNLNEKHVLSLVDLKLKDSKSKLYFELIKRGTASKDIFISSVLTKETGNVVYSGNHNFNETFNHTSKEYTHTKINLPYCKDLSFKNKKLSNETISFLNYDKRVLNYIKTVKSKNEVLFDTTISLKGLWLTETDNKTYYKVTYFEHE